MTRPQLYLWIASVWLVGCSSDAQPSPPGLTLISQIQIDSTADHLGEFVQVGEALIVSNSNDALSVLRHFPDGRQERSVVSYPDLDVRCTTIDVHTPSNTLYCATDDSGELRTFSIEDPLVPTYRGVVADDAPANVRDLTVVDETLWLSRFNHGLAYASILENGEVGERTTLLTSDNVRFVEGADDGELVVLTANRGLVGLSRVQSASSASPSEWEETWQQTLAGPALDLSVRGRYAMAALGSEGVVVVDLETSPPGVVQHLYPHGVVTSADLDGDALAVATLTGVYLYDLRGEPRVAGYYPSGRWGEGFGGSMLSVRFRNHEVVVSDWAYIERFGVNLDGETAMVDVQRSVYVDAQKPVSWAVYNPSALPREVVFSVAGEEFAEGVVPPGGHGVVTSSREDLFPAGRRRIVHFYVRDAGVFVGHGVIVVYRTEPDHEPTQVGKPAPGMTFPPVRLVTFDDSRIDLPLTRRQRVIWYTQDCMAMWPELEDAAYLARQGRLDGGAIPVFAGTSTIYSGIPGERFGDRLLLGGSVDGRFSDPPADVTAINHILEPLYAYGFWIEQLPSGAHHPTDYVVDEDGQVLAVEREYRGAYPLRPPKEDR